MRVVFFSPPLLLALFGSIGCSKGESLASLDLKDKASEKTIDTVAGDTLQFATAAVVDLSSLPGGARERENAAYNALRRTKLTVKVTGPSGEQTVSCPLYDGNASSTSVNSSILKSNGMTNTCVVPLSLAGAHTIKATASFDPLILVHQARLEVRRAGAKK
jgi:hypothetical protein